MPFVIEKRGDRGWCVFTQGADGEATGEAHGCHATHEQAREQQKALYVNVPEARKEAEKPYGDVTYADPGYQSDGKKRYPIDTAAHVRAAWSYINQADNRGAYSAEELSRIEGRIRAAAKRFGIEMSDTKETGLLYFPGQEIKAYGNGQLKGLLVPFGSVDSDGDLFDGDTDFDFEDGDRRSGYFRHTLDPQFGNRRIGRGTLTKERAGVMLEGRLNLDDPAVEPLWERARKGEFGLSSGAPNHMVRRYEIKSGVQRVTHWPVSEWSVTGNPAHEHARILSVKEYLGAPSPAGAMPPEAGLTSDIRRLLTACEQYLTAEAKEGKVLSSANLTSIQRVGSHVQKMYGHVIRGSSGDTQKAMIAELDQMKDLVNDLLTAGGGTYGPLSSIGQMQRQLEDLQRATQLRTLGVPVSYGRYTSG